MIPKSIPVSEFKAKCLSLLDEVSATRVALVITKRGMPVARVVPLDMTASEEAPSLLGSVRYSSEEDLLAPVGMSWNAES